MDNTKHAATATTTTTTTNVPFLKTDNNTIINENRITWVRKMNECLEVCLKTTGCGTLDTHSICKIYSPESYKRLNDIFGKS
jgi:hypothetical protein